MLICLSISHQSFSLSLKACQNSTSERIHCFLSSFDRSLRFLFFGSDQYGKSEFFAHDGASIGAFTPSLCASGAFTPSLRDTPPGGEFETSSCDSSDRGEFRAMIFSTSFVPAIGNVVIYSSTFGDSNKCNHRSSPPSATSELNTFLHSSFDGV